MSVTAKTHSFGLVIFSLFFPFVSTPRRVARLRDPVEEPSARTCKGSDQTVDKNVDNKYNLILALITAVHAEHSKSSLKDVGRFRYGLCCLYWFSKLILSSTNCLLKINSLNTQTNWIQSQEISLLSIEDSWTDESTRTKIKTSRINIIQCNGSRTAKDFVIFNTMDGFVLLVLSQI